MEEEGKGEVFQSPPEFQNRFSRSKPPSPAKRYLVIISFIVILGLIIFGVIRFIGGSKSDQNTTSPTPTIETFPTNIPEPTEEDVTPTKEPTKTPTPKPTINPIDKASGLNRSKLSVHVLNGSGITGAARKAADSLEGLGYNIIQIGNADSSTYEKTIIQIKSAKDNYLDLLKKDLSSSYSLGTASADLSDSERPDVIVIVGKE